MERTTPVCSQLLSIDGKRNSGDVEPSLALRYGINTVESDEALVMEHDIEEGAMHMQFAISARPSFVINEPELAELVHKETDA
jgi:hypothetical protein